MTREEAIKYLKEMKDECNDTIHKVRYVTQEEALEMAIKALEQESSGDLISRQLAIDIMAKLEQEDIDTYGCSIPEGFDGERAIEALKQLPSVNQQEPKWDRLYSWLNDMRLGITPDETVTDIDERNVRTAQVDLLDEIMEWMLEPQESEVSE